MSAPLFIVQEKGAGRYLVKDRGGNVLFMTDLGDSNPENTAVKWAIREGGWLAGILEGGSISSSIKI